MGLLSKMGICTIIDILSIILILLCVVVLLTKDAKGKVRVVEVDSSFTEDPPMYKIMRTTYTYGCKKTVQPDIFITKGKAARTLEEQFNLEYSAIIKKYKDKSYKEVPENIDINDNQAVMSFVESVIPDGVTDSNGFKKHMLAKPADSVATRTFDAIDYWYGSRKPLGSAQNISR